MLFGIGHGQLVIIKLHGTLADTGLGDSPPVRPRLRRPRRHVLGPVEIAGINVGCQPPFKAVKLVGTDEMHLPAQARLVTARPQVMREGRDFRHQLGRIVIGPDFRRQLACHHRSP